MGAALSYKRGENKHPSQEVKHVADSMTETQLEDMAKKPVAAKKRKCAFISFGIPCADRQAGCRSAAVRLWIDGCSYRVYCIFNGLTYGVDFFSVFF